MYEAGSVSMGVKPYRPWHRFRNQFGRLSELSIAHLSFLDPIDTNSLIDKPAPKVTPISIREVADHRCGELSGT